MSLINRTKILLLVESGVYSDRNISAALRDYGHIVTIMNHADNAYTLDFVKDKYDIIAYCLYSTTSAAKLLVAKQCFEAGIPFMDFGFQQSYSNNPSALINYFNIATATGQGTSAPDSIYFEDDGLSIVRRSGLSYDKTVKYVTKVDSVTNINTFILTPSHPSMKTLYVASGAPTEKRAILALKGTPTTVYPSGIPAHYIVFGDQMQNNNPSKNLSPDYAKYLNSVVAFLAKLFIIKGTVKDSTGQPVVRDLHIYLRSNGAYIETITPNAQGEFEYQINMQEEVFIVAKAKNNETAPTVVYDKIIPSIDLH